MAIRSAYASHVGLVREHNEDACLACPELGLWVVADGMGGHMGGEIASAMVINELDKRIAGGESLVDAVGATHHAVLEAVARGEGQYGMGSTVVALQVNGSSYQVAWVGDSRAYLMGKYGLRQISRDHSFVQQLLDAGVIAKAEAAVHPDRNVISQAIGTVGLKAVSVDSVNGQLYQGDQILLCSDGLTGEVDDEQIARLLAAPGNEAQHVESLIAAALEHGGSDNVTVILVSASDIAPAHPERGSTIPVSAALLNQALTSKNRTGIPQVVALALAFGLILTLGMGYWLLLDWTVNRTHPPAFGLPAKHAQSNASMPSPPSQSKGGNDAKIPVQK